MGKGGLQELFKELTFWLKQKKGFNCHFTLDDIDDYISQYSSDGKEENIILVTDYFTYVTGKYENGKSVIYKYNKEIYLNQDVIASIEIDGEIEGIRESIDGDLFVMALGKIDHYNKDLGLMESSVLS